MDLDCYVFPGWRPLIRPASAHRGWMDAAPESFPYRCLPLAIANAHGWEVLTPAGFTVEWNGGPAPEDVTVTAEAGADPQHLPIALFGLGTFTIHIEALFRTPPGWNLLVSGPPNEARDGVAPLTGIIETDWSPYTFTMNWRLTRPGRIAFAAGEAIAHLFPVQRGALEAFAPRFRPIDEAPELKAEFLAWSHSRDAFQAAVKANPPEKPADKWQKLYYRGFSPNGACPVKDHVTKLRLRDVAQPEVVTGGGDLPFPAEPPAPAQSQPAPTGSWPERKYAWLLETLERQRALSATASDIYRVQDVSADEFLDNFYAPNRPVVLCGVTTDWPDHGGWSASWLRQRLATRAVELQAGRTGNPRFEMDKAAHRMLIPFGEFMDRIERNPGNDTYITAWNSAANAEAFAELRGSLGTVPGILDAAGAAAGMFWIGPAGTFTPLHHDLTNNLLIQLEGRKQVVLAAPSSTPRLYNEIHVFSAVPDLTDPAIDLARRPLLAGLRTWTVELAPGDALFIPVGWWHQVKALDFSVSLTCTNFSWPNDAYRDHPSTTP